MHIIFKSLEMKGKEKILKSIRGEKKWHIVYRGTRIRLYQNSHYLCKKNTVSYLECWGKVANPEFYNQQKKKISNLIPK